MAKSVPTGSSLKKAGKTGLFDGGTLAVGEIAGRSVLGPGAGTAVGGILAASSESGATRDTMATIAVERAIQEMV